MVKCSRPLADAGLAPSPAACPWTALPRVFPSWTYGVEVARPTTGECRMSYRDRFGGAGSAGEETPLSKPSLVSTTVRSDGGRAASVSSAAR